MIKQNSFYIKISKFSFHILLKRIPKNSIDQIAAIKLKGFLHKVVITLLSIFVIVFRSSILQQSNTAESRL